MGDMTGGCLCGANRYRIGGKLGALVYCHCSQCRRISGSAFSAIAGVRTRYFTWSRGGDVLGEFESSPGKFRVFCPNCGCPLYSRRPAQPDVLTLRLGTLDDDPGRRLAAHIWVGSMASWHTIDDDRPRFEEDAPSEDSGDS